MREQSFKEYNSRVNTAIDYLRSNLDNKVTLDELAQAVHLSKFHFLRVFQLITGVSPGEYHTRLRLQRAQFRMISHSPPSITEIAYDLGFSSVAALCKSFKKSKQASPLEWRARYISKLSNFGQSQQLSDQYFSTIFNQSIINMEKELQFHCQLKELKDQPVVYFRNFAIHVHDSQGFDTMFKKLFDWAGSRSLLNFPDTKALTVYRSMPDEKGFVQADVCLTVSSDIKGEGEIGNTIIPGGTYAVVHKEGTLDECFLTWEYLYKNWLPDSGYKADSRGVFLNHLNSPEAHPKGFHVFEMNVSVQRI